VVPGGLLGCWRVARGQITMTETHQKERDPVYSTSLMQRVAATTVAGLAVLAMLGRCVSASADDNRPEGFSFKQLDDKSLELREGDRPVLVYNFGEITDAKVPKKDPRRTQGCFIHPLWGLNGEVLTDTFPKDHYHHHGIFWAWPHVGIDGHEYDLWQNRRDIHQRFVRWLGQQAGPATARLGVENGWFVDDRKVMIERVWLEAHRATANAQALDLSFEWIPVDKPITLRGAEGKSYGGLTLRYAPRKDTVITVPSGASKEDLPETPLAWADLTGRFANVAHPSGAAIFVDPHHPDFPPTWLTRHYGVLCVGWPGVKDRTFQPGVPIRLNYRIWIHRDVVDTTALKEAFEAYSAAEKNPGKPEQK
jgi:hypothetical protein